MTAKPKRRWYQYSLRSMFVLTTLVAMACSWYAYEMKQAAERRAAIWKIERLGGEVVYYNAADPHTPGEPPSWHSWLRKLHGDAHLGNPASVVLRTNEVTDDDLVNVKCLPNLQVLLLDGTQTSDAGLARLKDLDKLAVLGLAATQITDRGVAQLKSFSDLQWIDLFDTQITDTGLMYVEGLKNLEYIDLGNTEVTDEGVKRLQEALPSCTINPKPPSQR